MDALYDTWKILCKQTCLDNRQIEEQYEEIKLAYQEAHRYYHTLDHIRSMIEEIQTSADPAIDKVILLWATYFHDVLYDPKANDNELKSSKKAGQVMQLLHVSEDRILQVNELILSTANHTKSRSGATLDFFLDCDLKILGSSSEEYERYAENIRKEYKHVPSILYKHERKKVLKRFIETPAIYRTKRFYERYEKQARTNILNEIERL